MMQASHVPVMGGGGFVDEMKPQKGSKSSWFSNLSLKYFDILYVKINPMYEDYKVQTQSGGYFTIIGWVLIAILLMGSYYDYMTPKIKDHMVVDTTLDSTHSLKINLNMTFHALSCAETHLDAMDVSGDNQLNIEHDMYKQRVSKNGILIGKPYVELVGSNIKHEDKQDVKGNPIKPVKVGDWPPDNYCGSCFGAETDTRKCCNSCDELKVAYKAKGWSVAPILKGSEQCQHDSTNPFANVEPGEGCRVTGTMHVNKVAGNIHIAHGESIVRDGRHIHQFLPQDAPNFNISHTIHKLSFGDAYPYMPDNPLDKHVRMIPTEGSTGLFQYFIKIIPTIYTSSATSYTTKTNQYTVTEKFRPLMLPQLNVPGQPMKLQQAVLPGIFFIYDVSPFMIEVQHEYTPFFHFFTKACAIVGGVFSVMGFIDIVWFKLLQKKKM